MKKAIYIVVFWMAAIFLTSILLTSLGYNLWEAVLMSLSFLPASLALCFFLPNVERNHDGKKRILNTIYVILGVMVMTFLLIYVWQLAFITLVYQEDYAKWTLPAMLGNPVFVGVILSILAYGNYLLMKWLDKKYLTDRPITFTSDYKKVSLKKEDILYVESRDSEVWIVTRDGPLYRNKTGITQWENLLGPRFLRVHRSFLVNISYAVLSASDVVSVGRQEIPVSRKYKESVMTILPNDSSIKRKIQSSRKMIPFER